MALKSAKEKLLSFAISFDSEIVGVGQTPPTVYSPNPETSLVLQEPDREQNNSPAPDNSESNQDQILNSSFSNVKIEPNRIIPYATSHIFNHDIPAIKDMLRARRMEDKLENMSLQKLYEIAEGGPSSDVITSAIESIDEEVENVDVLLAAVESLVRSLDQVERVFNQSSQESLITQEFSSEIEKLSLPPDGQDETQEVTSFLEALSQNSGISVSDLQDYKITGTFLQALADAEYSLTRGLSPSFFIEQGQRDPGVFDRISTPSFAVNQASGTTIKKIKQIGIGDNRAYEGILGPQNALAKVPSVSSLSSIEKVAYLCAVLSSEYKLSTGIGITRGTTLGNKFKVSGDSPVASLFGADKIGKITAEDAVPGSLADCAITNPDGNLTVLQGQKRIQLFEGSNPTSTAYSTSKIQWLDTVKKDPLNNKVHQFDKAIEETLNIFDDASSYMKNFLLLEQETSLLTAKGLLVRILKDFSSLLQGITVETDQAKLANSAISLSILLYAAKGSSSMSSEINSMRKALFIFLARAAHNQQNQPKEDDDFVPSNAVEVDTEEEVINRDTGGVRLTSAEASNTFKYFINSVSDDKRNIAVALGKIAQSDEIKASTSTTIKKTGETILEVLSDPRGDNNISSIIVSIYQDIQEEAKNICNSAGDDKGFVRPGGTTNYSGFDGALTLAFIYECFSILANEFCALEMVLNPATKSVMSNLGNNPGIVGRINAAESFMTKKHTIKIQAGSSFGSRTNKLRKFLQSLTDALQNNDLSGLVSANGEVAEITGLNELTNLSTSGSTTPSEMIDVCNRLMKSENMPMENFCIAKATAQALKNSTQDLAMRAAALRGDINDVPEDIAILKQLGESQIGRDFINGLDRNQLGHARARIEVIKKSEDAPYSLNMVSDNFYKCFEFLLDEKENEFVHSAILFVGMPSGATSKELLDKSIAPEDSEVSFSISKVSELFSTFKYSKVKKSFCPKYRLRDEMIDAAFDETIKPTNFNELVLMTSYDVLGEDEPVLGTDIVSLSNDPTQTREHLVSLMESVILKKMIKALQQINVEETMIQTDFLKDRGFGILPTLRALSSAAGINENVPDLFLKKTTQGYEMPGKLRVSQLIQPKKAIVKGIDGWKSPETTPEELEVIYQIMSTKPFLIERVEKVVMTRTMFDDVYAIMINLDEFEFLSNLSYWAARVKGKLGQYLDEKHKSTSPDRLSIESLYVSSKVEAL